MKNVKIDYQVVPLTEIKVENKTEGVKKLEFINIGGQTFMTTPRFWNSFCSKFQVSDNIFNYFSTEEVFDRISRVQGGSSLIRVALESGNKESKALSISSPSNQLLDFNGTKKLLDSVDRKSVYYHNGVVSSVHIPRSGEAFGLIGSEEFSKQFVLTTPIDGYGEPKITLQLTRLVCVNGMVALDPVFTTRVPVSAKSKNQWHTLQRAIEGFDNEDSYVLIRDRLVAAQNSPASLREATKFLEVIYKHGGKGRQELVDKYLKVTGSPVHKYGIANVNALSEKQQRLLKTDASVYEVVNFATEMATHIVEDIKSRLAINGFVGSLITKEYDLENTGIKGKSFEQFLIK